MTFPDTDPDTYLELARDQLSLQHAAADAIEAKTGTWFGIASTLTGILAAIVAFKSPGTPAQTALAVATATSYVVTTIFALVSFLSRVWEFGPDLAELELARRANAWTPDQVKWVALRTLRNNYQANKRPYGRRVLGLRVIASSLACQTILLGFLALSLVKGW